MTVVAIKERQDGVEIQCEWFESLAMRGQAKAHDYFLRRHFARCATNDSCYNVRCSRQFSEPQNEQKIDSGYPA